MLVVTQGGRFAGRTYRHYAVYAVFQLEVNQLIERSEIDFAVLKRRNQRHHCACKHFNLLYQFFPATKAQRHQDYKIILFIPFFITGTLKLIRKPIRLPVNLK
ncbi:hypothetical protein ES703_31325 [subsurface metagenome]